MRRSIAAVGAVVLGFVALTPGASPAAPIQTDPGLSPADQVSVDAGLPVAARPSRAPSRPGSTRSSPCYRIASKADYSGWATYMKKQALGEGRRPAEGPPGTSAAAAKAAAAAVVVDEDEPAAPGAPTTPATAQLIKGFGTGAGRTRRSASSARSTPRRSRRPPGRHPEDDGSIPLAGDTGIGAGATAIVTSRHRRRPARQAGTGTGDFDFYVVDGHRRADADRGHRTRRPGRWTRWSRCTTPTARSSPSNDDAGGALDSLLQYKVPAPARTTCWSRLRRRCRPTRSTPASGDGGGERGPVRRHDHGRRLRQRLLRRRAAKPATSLGASVRAGAGVT